MSRQKLPQKETLDPECPRNKTAELAVPHLGEQPRAGHVPCCSLHCPWHKWEGWTLCSRKSLLALPLWNLLRISGLAPLPSAPGELERVEKVAQAKSAPVQLQEWGCRALLLLELVREGTASTWGTCSGPGCHPQASTSSGTRQGPQSSVSKEPFLCCFFLLLFHHHHSPYCCFILVISILLSLLILWSKKNKNCPIL